MKMVEFQGSSEEGEIEVIGSLLLGCPWRSGFFTVGHGRLARVDRGGAFQGPCPSSILRSE